uniref:Putative ovule protein n=1 Tax=Solanum chacoense TaxID=4108 RepID=A0A0V0H0T9_SOLCH
MQSLSLSLLGRDVFDRPSAQANHNNNKTEKDSGEKHANEMWRIYARNHNTNNKVRSSKHSNRTKTTLIQQPTWCSIHHQTKYMNKLVIVQLLTTY